MIVSTSTIPNTIQRRFRFGIWVFAWICAANLFFGCNDGNGNVSPEPSGPEPRDASSQVKPIPPSQVCAPEDTTLWNGITVEYEIHEDYFDLVVGKGKLRKALGYKFNCDAPPNIVPKVTSSGNDFVGLWRTCGSYCSMTFFVEVSDSLRISEWFENVVAIDSSAKELAYLDGWHIVVSDFKGAPLRRFDTNQKCATMTTCISKAYFENGKVVVHFEDGSVLVN